MAFKDADILLEISSFDKFLHQVVQILVLFYGVSVLFLTRASFSSIAPRRINFDGL